MIASRHALSMLLLLAAFCGGCSSKPTPAGGAAQTKTEEELIQERLEKKEKEPPFEIGKLTPQLSQKMLDALEAEPLQLIKPGHWTATVQQMKSNYEDFSGRTVIAAVDSKRFKPLPLRYLPFALESTRAVTLAKKRPKSIHNELFIPDSVARVHVTARVERAGSGQVVDEDGPRTELWSAMPSHQYFFLVLAREPARYAYLKVTDAVRGPWEDDSAQYSDYYRVVLADGNKALPLPPNVLTWTSVAYVLWDEVNVDRLDADQQHALLDWIHWGGRLIVNGPDSLAALRNSFLGDVLPADPGEAERLDQQRLAPLASHWGDRQDGKPLTTLKPTAPWSAVRLQLRDGARFIPNTANLLCERNVGRGSIVVSAMQLSERDFINWPGYDGFLNGALLGRPARKFGDGPFVGYRATWSRFAERRLDAHLSTPLRWFARDADTQANTVVPESVLRPRRRPGVAGAYYPPYGGQFEVEPAKIDRPSGLGGWDEFNPVSVAARSALRKAAGVRVPAAGFVVGCLTVYLLVLVPLNWMVFHALGRIEWAWAAAPVIALAGTVLIVHQANLDIGFVRAQTEISLLELNGAYPRGHLSRYNALYASLSTAYDMEFDRVSAVAKPFPADDGFRMKMGDWPTNVAFEKYDRTRLRGVDITSASTRFIHSEEMSELAGGLVWSTSSIGGRQVRNDTGYDLQDAVIVHRKFNAGKPVFETAWLGLLRAGDARGVAFDPSGMLQSEIPYQTERAAAAKLQQRRLDVDEILKIAFQFSKTDPLYSAREEYRLVALIDQPLPGAAVQPTPSQTIGTTVVLAHLDYGPRRDFEPDVNSPIDVTDNVRARPLSDVPDADDATDGAPVGESAFESLP